MKMTSSSALGVFLLVVLSSTAPAFAGCASALAPSSDSLVPLPNVCQAMGPIRLMMRSADVVKLLGASDLTHTHGDTTELVYVFPRDLAKHLREHPEPESYIQQNVGYVRIMLRNHMVVTISGTGQSGSAMPYGVGGITVGESIYPLLHSMKIKPSWNNSKDNIYFLPYPMEVSVNPISSQVTGITIAVGAPIFGPAPMISLNRQTGTDMVYGYSVHFSP